ncbi:MAG: transcriptional regulator, putative ATPase, winged helix family, partial [Acidimicrobiia bacterium]|nr:transcriptional regulator, putative ATPase, winged helix family [Acidimicrobiia bacterium]
MSELRIDLLGELRVFLGGTPVDPGPRMQRALLTLLAVDAPKVVSVDRLIDELWGDAAPSAAHATLQAYVSQLRRVLEPNRAPRAAASLLITRDPGYALRIDPAGVDWFRFQHF